MTPPTLLAPLGLLWNPATALMDRLSHPGTGSRVPATPPPDYAAGLAFHSLGHGTPVLLLHGLASSRGAFNPIFTELARRHRVIAVDLPGHGDSELPDRGEPLTPRAQAYALGAFLDALGLDKVHVVGNSMGGWVALELAADGRALSVTGLCPAGLWRPIPNRSPLLEFNRHAAVAFGAVGEALMLIRPLRELVFSAALARPDKLDYGTARGALGAQRAAIGYDEAHDGIVGARFERAADISSQVPVTIAFGAEDLFLPPRSAQLRHLAPQHSRWVIMPRVGHAPMWDDPTATVALIRSTIAG